MIRSAFAPGTNPMIPYAGNVLEERNKILSYPLRTFGPELLKGMEKGQSAATTVSAMALMAYAAAPTFFGNIMLPANLISSGLRPQPVLEGLSHYIPHVHLPTRSYWLEPVFSVKHGASSAYKAGARVGGKIGGRIGARLIPGVGYALLAYDVYDIGVNRSLWGFDL